MKYLEFYKRMENPMNGDSLDRIVDAYVENDDFYDGIIGINANGKIANQYNVRDKARLDVFLFNEWKKNIHELDRNTEFYRCFGEQFSKLDRYLSMSNPQTSEEIDKIMDPYQYRDDDLRRAFENFSWRSVGDYWTHIISGWVYRTKHSEQDIEHRFYLNCDSTVTHRLCYEFAKRCKAENLNYYFKYDKHGDRADNIVFYCDTKNLLHVRRIINEVVRDCGLSRNLHKPPVLTGVVDGFIGYGSEPLYGGSFNSKRQKHLNKCIRRTTGLWIKNNLNFKITLNGRQIYYGEYFIIHIAQTIKKYLLSSLPTDAEYAAYREFLRREVLSSSFDKKLKDEISRNFSNILTSLMENDDDKSLGLMRIPLSNGSDVVIPSSCITDSLKQQTKTIKRISTTFKPNLLKIVRKTSKDFDIDPNNYAFDVPRLERLIEADEYGRTSYIDRGNTKRK